MKLNNKQIKSWKKSIIKNDIENIKSKIEQDLKDSLKNGITIKQWLKQIKKCLKGYRIFELYKNYFNSYIHVLAIQIAPGGYAKINK